MLTLKQFADIPQAGEEHIHMETGFYGNENTLIITNSTDAEYSETFVDVRTAQQYPSRDHARSAY